MKGATTAAAGTAGFVPAPAKSYNTRFLRGDGTWQVPTNTTYSNMTGASASSAGKAGLVPAPAAGYNTRFLRGDGTWADVVAGQGNIRYVQSTDMIQIYYNNTWTDWQYAGLNVVSLIPKMTSNTAPSGSCTSSGTNGSCQPYAAFDGNSTSEGWVSSEITDKWVQYQFASKVNIKKVTVTMMHQGTNLNFRIYLANSSNQYTEALYKAITTTAGTYFTQTFEFANATEAYGIRIHGNSDAVYRFCVKEVVCYGYK